MRSRAKAQPQPARNASGFTLVELIMVIVITGVIAVMLTIFLRPAMDGFFDTRNRAEMGAMAENALRTMIRDVRSAVPNSIRLPGSQCFELVPARTGGRYRMERDTVNDAACVGAACSAWVDTSVATTGFDVLAPAFGPVSVGDWVLINNQNGNDVYVGSNRSLITGLSTPVPVSNGVQRIAIQGLQISPGYDGGRFYIVSKAEQALFYSCVGADGQVDSNGDGKGTLRRFSGYGFNAAYPSSCPSVGGEVVASKIKSCTFVYDPSQGATLQNGFIWLDLEVSRNFESAHISMGGHVPNLP